MPKTTLIIVKAIYLWGKICKFWKYGERGTRLKKLTLMLVKHTQNLEMCSIFSEYPNLSNDVLTLHVYYFNIISQVQPPQGEKCIVHFIIGH